MKYDEAAALILYLYKESIDFPYIEIQSTDTWKEALKIAYKVLIEKQNE